MSAIWHIRTEDRARLSAELTRLDSRLLALDDRIRDATNRQRYGSPEEMARVAHELDSLAADLDRLMTRERAIEAKLLLLQKESGSDDQRTGMAPPRSVAPTSRELREAAERLAVEVHRGVTERGAG